MMGDFIAKVGKKQDGDHAMGNMASALEMP